MDLFDGKPPGLGKAWSYKSWKRGGRGTELLKSKGASKSKSIPSALSVLGRLEEVGYGDKWKGCCDCLSWT